MGMLHLRRAEVSVESLVASASAIAVVRPAVPPTVVEEVVLGGGGDDTGVPRPGRIRYARVFQRAEVTEWLRRPSGGAPGLVELESPSNEAAARDAHDAARGMLGHVHHIVIEHVLAEVPDAWKRVDRAGPRIVFLRPLSIDPAAIRFAEAFGGLTLPVDARERVMALLRPAPAPAGQRRSPAGLAVAAVAAIAAVVAALAAWRACG